MENAVLKSTAKLAFSGLASSNTAKVTVFPARGTMPNKNITLYKSSFKNIKNVLSI